MEKTKRISLVTLITALALTSGILLPLSVRAAKLDCYLMGSATVALVCPGGVHTPNPNVPTPTVAGTSNPNSTSNPSSIKTDHIMITEVYYDVDDDHGKEGANEWVEIHNATGSDVDLTGWSIVDVTTQRYLPEVVLPSDCFAIITDEAETVDYWEIPEQTTIFALEKSIGNGLGNIGDFVAIVDNNTVIVDSISWGDNIDAFDPSAIDVKAGHSLVRKDIYRDHDNAEDWIEQENPTPGSL